MREIKLDNICNGKHHHRQSNQRANKRMESKEKQEAGIWEDMGDEKVAAIVSKQ